MFLTCATPRIPYKETVHEFTYQGVLLLASGGKESWQTTANYSDKINIIVDNTACTTLSLCCAHMYRSSQNEYNEQLYMYEESEAEKSDCSIIYMRIGNEALTHYYYCCHALKSFKKIKRYNDYTDFRDYRI